MNLDLKPCPFCGADAVFFVDNGVRIICKNCDAQTRTLIDGSVNTSVGAVERVADKWNRRVVEPPKKQRATFLEDAFSRPLCGKCGTMIQRDYKFCPECGVEIEWGGGKQ